MTNDQEDLRSQIKLHLSDLEKQLDFFYQVLQKFKDLLELELKALSENKILELQRICEDKKNSQNDIRVCHDNLIDLFKIIQECFLFLTESEVRKKIVSLLDGVELAEKIVSSTFSNDKSNDANLLLERIKSSAYELNDFFSSVKSLIEKNKLVIHKLMTNHQESFFLLATALHLKYLHHTMRVESKR